MHNRRAPCIKGRGCSDTLTTTAELNRFWNGSKNQHTGLALTDHQLKILAALAAGRSNLEIGKAFGITENTVKKIVSTIFAKLGASSRVEAVAIAHREHLVEI